MKTKPFTLTLTFLFLFSGSFFGDDLQNGINATERGDFKKAHKLITPLAEPGHPESQYLLGLAYRTGVIDVEYQGEEILQSHKEAIKWFRLSAEQGHPESQYLLGLAYRKGEGVLQSHKEAIKWLLKSAEQKNVKAQKLIRTNYDQWHKQIAELGDSYAQKFLGASYYLGLGVTQDYAEAAKWYKKAAEQEDRVAQNILGAMYEKGKGVSKDFVEAYKWFSVSGETGNARMYKEKIGKRKMTSVQIVEAQKLAREWTEQHQKK